MLQTIALYVMIFSGSGLVAIFVNSMWKRYIRLKASEPRLDLEWVDDCATHATASFKGSNITLKNVRDFSWKNKREHDSKWINTKVKIDEIVDVWFVIAHFHKIKGLAHTMLTFEFKDGQFITFSFETRREAGERYHPWKG